MDLGPSDDGKSSAHKSKREAATGVSKIQISITGMTCASCVNTIETSLSSKEGKISRLKFVLPHMRIPAHMRMGYPIRVWDNTVCHTHMGIPYEYTCMSVL